MNTVNRQPVQREWPWPFSLQPFLYLCRRLWAMAVVRLALLTVYYLLLIAALIMLYGNSVYKPPPFIYQGF